VKIKDYFKNNPLTASNEGLANLIFLELIYLNGLRVDLISPIDKSIHNFVSSSTYVRRLSAKQVILELLNDDPLFHELEQFREFEFDQMEKVGTYSVILPFHERSSGVTNFYEGRASDSISDLLFSKLFFSSSKVSALILEDSLSKLSLDEVYLSSEKSTQWGLPFMLKGNSTIDGIDSGLCYLELARRDLSSGMISPFPAVMVHRTQSSGTDKPKQRVAWALPHSLILVELTYQAPLLNRFKSLFPFPEHVSQELTDLRACEIFRLSKEYSIPIIGFDASNYDASIPKYLIRLAYELISSWFGEDFTESSILYQLYDYMSGCDLVTPIGVFTDRRRGVASGSGLTNVIDCLVQLILFEFVVGELSADRSKCRIIVNGDDGIWLIPGLTPDLLSSLINQFGLECNPDKVSFGYDHFTFCQRLYHRRYLMNGLNVGIRSAFRTVNGIIGYERRRPVFWNSLMESVRIIMQLHELRNNPIHYDLVMFLINVDEFGLGSKYKTGVYGLIRDAGGFEAVISLTSGSSYEKERAKLLTKNIYNMSTIRLIDDHELNQSL
jgi:hypothetical protein